MLRKKTITRDMRKMKGDGEIDKREKKWANTTLFLFKKNFFPRIIC